MEDASLRQDFSKFYAASFQRMFGVAWRAAGRDKDAAFDATQETYVVMLKLWLADDKPEDFSRYVAGMK